MSEYPAIVTSKLKLKCLQCDRSFLRIKALHNHCLTHHQTRCSCSRCKGASDIHKFLWEDEKLYYCRKCGAEYSTPERLAHHTEQEHTKQQQWCVICREGFNDLARLSMHIRDTHYDVEDAEEPEEEGRSGSKHPRK